MKKTLTTLALLAMLAGCSFAPKSGFHTATEANTSRFDGYRESILEQAVNDLTVINDCFVRSKDQGRCETMAGMLRTQSNMMTLMAPFIAPAVFQGVPAAPEEIFASLAKEGMKFALMKFGIDRVTNLVSSGQYAAWQSAQQANGALAASNATAQSQVGTAQGALTSLAQRPLAPAAAPGVE